ncbi:hypothetical protein ACP6H1_25740 [Vibrio harveyi]|uniref:hypothetical protein n=1 Tax=Vibrio harveyi group TaxID=717610 RepID=UPI00215C20C5|nr:hypothetical protein [Vibrio parahaemolyticus]MCR9835709.1 hypothetical protein [Vibrio parahaemolyticus]
MDYLGCIAEAPSYTAPPEIVSYTESQARFLPVRITRGDNDQYALLFSNENSNVVYLLNHTQSDAFKEAEASSLGTIDVNDCVIKCQEVLGLKINEIAKLSGVSRASLDLHRKGANVKDMNAYHKLYTFVSKVENLYGKGLKNSIRNVLVERKTLVQHFMKNIDNLELTLPLIADVSNKVQGITIADANLDCAKLGARLGRIGKMA